MISIQPMTPEEFARFKELSLSRYSATLAKTHDVSLATAAEFAAKQFHDLVPQGRDTPEQYFFNARESAQNIGYLWLGVREQFGRKILSINEIFLHPEFRGRGHSKRLMKLVEDEARRLGLKRIRLHVFHDNEVARKLYHAMGYSITNLDMRKDI